jgi:glycosyltransferase involved in cell wall biosynthesis
MVPALWRGEYDAVFIHSYATLLSVIAYLAAWISGTPVLLRTESGMLRQRSRLVAAVKRPLLRMFFCQTAGFLAIGESNRRFLASYGAPEAAVFDTPYAVDADYFEQQAEELAPHREALRREHGFSAETKVVVFSGKLIELKRVDDLLTAIGILQREQLKVGLLVIGDGSERERLERRAVDQQLSDIRFVGFKNQTELSPCYICGDAIVLPSRIETWGLVLNEGMVFGLPAVATDKVGAALDLVEHGVTGYIYPMGDVARLADCLRSLLSSPALDVMKQAARNRVRRYRPATCVHGIVTALEYVTRAGAERAC